MLNNYILMRLDDIPDLLDHDLNLCPGHPAQVSAVARQEAGGKPKQTIRIINTQKFQRHVQSSGTRFENFSLKKSFFKHLRNKEQNIFLYSLTDEYK
jgi:hypothetical protein